MAGKLTATATTPAPRSVTSRGVGSLVAPAIAQYSRAAALGGHGVVNANTMRKISDTAKPAGHGVLTVPTPEQIYQITSGASGNGALSGSGYQRMPAPSALPGNGALYGSTIQVPQFDQTGGSALGYGSSFTMTQTTAGPAIIMVTVATSAYCYADLVTYGANGALNATALAVEARDGNPGYGYLSIYYLYVGAAETLAVNVYLSGNGYYVGSSIDYLYAMGTPVLVGAANGYATGASMELNAPSPTPCVGFGAWSLDTSGAAFSATGGTERFGSFESTSVLIVNDIGPVTSAATDSFTCNQGAFYYGMAYQLPA